MPTDGELVTLVIITSDRILFDKPETKNAKSNY